MVEIKSKPVQIEVKSHDGPARLGKLEGEITPTIKSYNNLNIIKDEPTAYNIEYELANWGLEKTIENARNSKNSNASEDSNNEIAIIHGGKYLDLRLKACEELENLGYTGFIIANSDESLLRSRELVEMVVNIREKLSPNSYLIFPFAEASFIPILAYMGIDVFLDDIAEYYSYLNVLITPTKNYDLNQYYLSDEINNLSRESLEAKNKEVLDFVVCETQAHIKNGTLRNLVEERSLTSPQNLSTLKILDKEYNDYLSKYTQLY
ncbi:MAG: archaeosine tRNA-ribosyltransferase [Methanobacteriaceae archaeon]